MRTFLLLTLLSSLLISGCRQVPRPESRAVPTAISPVPAGAWTIKMVQSGGIMGLSRSLEVTSDGKFTVVDNRANKTINGNISPDELSNINDLVSSSEYIPPSKPNGMVCADCFIYELEIQTSGKKFAIQLNDISLPNSGLEPLVSRLSELMDTALQ